MHDKVLKTLCENCGDAKRILVALSGGVDSSVLLDVLVSLSETLNVSVCAAHLNHMLRGEDADADERFVKEKCEAYGIELISERIDIKKLSEESGKSIELCAREERYAFLERARILTGADVIATAHNANDNLETILFNLSRGSGLSGLCGIPYVRGNIIRPLLECSREEIEEYAKEKNISFCIDKTNDETEYTRNKIRHMVVKPLCEVNPSAVENALRTSRILKEQSAFIASSAELYAEKIRTGENSCSRIGLLSEPALIHNVCELYAGDVVGDAEYTLSYRHICAIESLLKGEAPSARVELPRGIVARREYENLVFEPFSECEADLPVRLCEGENFWGEYKIEVKKCQSRQKIHSLLNTFFIACDKIEGDLVVRSRKLGDEIRLPGRKRKSLKKLFVDEKVPQKTRDYIPVIADSEKVFAVFGFGENELAKSDSEDGYIIKITEK